MPDSTGAAEAYGYHARDVGEPKSHNPYFPAQFDLFFAWVKGWEESNRSWDSLDAV